MQHDFIRFHKAVAYIDSFSNLPLFAEYMKAGKQSHPEIYLKRMRYFLKLLGNPEKGFKFVHVTGTAGKGTVATMIHNALVAKGKKSGLFTSPHVVCAIEKIQVGNLYIAPDEFADMVEKIKPFIDKAYVSGEFGHPSHFEIYFAMALLYFQEKKCEFAVLEVGCGGRFDATNIIKPPVASAITCIDYDHTEVLGNTLKAIAYDKAGIIKRGSRFFTAERRPALLKMFEKICRQKGASFTFVPSEDADANEALASAVLESLGIDGVLAKKEIRNTRLPARFEVVARKPLIIIDGAHNRSKMAYTAALIKKEKFGKLFLVIGISDNKDSQDIFGKILPLAHEVFFTRFATRDRKPAPPLRLLRESKKYLRPSVKTAIYLDSSDALTAAQSRTGKNDCILITGSFFLAGELRKHWFSEETILKNRRSF